MTDMTVPTSDPAKVAAPVDPTAPKKAQPASSPLSLAPAPIATPAPASPAPGAAKAPTAPAAPSQTPGQTAIASATQNTTDPMAFAPSPSISPNGGGTPPGAMTPDAPQATPATSPASSFVPTGNLSYDSGTGQVTDSGQTLPLDQYLQAMVSSGRAHNIDEARLQALGSASTGITYAGTGATQYAPGRGPSTASTPSPTAATPSTPADIAASHFNPNTTTAHDTNPSVLPSNIARAVIPPTDGSDPNGPETGDPLGGPRASVGGGVPNASSGPNAGVGLTPTDPSNPLTAQTITPNNTVNRVKLAQDSLQSTIDNILNPQFQADERATNALSFGAGRGVSGMNRTALGNVESDYERQKANLTNEVLNPAITGSIDDLYKNIGISQQQQGFQADQQKTAFAQAAQAQGLSDSETAQAFQQALQMFYAGQIDDPTQFLEYLSGQYAQPVKT